MSEQPHPQEPRDNATGDMPQTQPPAPPPAETGHGLDHDHDHDHDRDDAVEREVAAAMSEMSEDDLAALTLGAAPAAAPEQPPAGVQLGRFPQHLLAQIGMLLRQLMQRGLRPHGVQPGFDAG